jgi:hypothetical protein
MFSAAYSNHNRNRIPHALPPGSHMVGIKPDKTTRPITSENPSKVSGVRVMRHRVFGKLFFDSLVVGCLGNCLIDKTSGGTFVVLFSGTYVCRPGAFFVKRNARPRLVVYETMSLVDKRIDSEA